MRLILSPAKNMRADPSADAGRPRFPDETAKISDGLRALDPWQLESLMKISPPLVLRTWTLIQNFDLGAEGTPAVLAYQGLCYQRLGAADFTEEELRFAAGQVMILSALYGALGAIDGIVPHRLEFLCGVQIDGQNLYRFWGDKIYRAVFGDGETVVNLASAEYAKTVLPFLSRGDRMISCAFVTRRRGKLITLAAEAKAARGRMARFVIQNRIEDPERLAAFAWNGYEYCGELSSAGRLVFLK